MIGIKFIFFGLAFCFGLLDTCLSYIVTESDVDGILNYNFTLAQCDEEQINFERSVKGLKDFDELLNHTGVASPLVRLMLADVIESLKGKNEKHDYREDFISAMKRIIEMKKKIIIKAILEGTSKSDKFMDRWKSKFAFPDLKTKVALSAPFVLFGAGLGLLLSLAIGTSMISFFITLIGALGGLMAFSLLSAQLRGFYKDMSKHSFNAADVPNVVPPTADTNSPS